MFVTRAAKAFALGLGTLLVLGVLAAVGTVCVLPRLVAENTATTRVAGGRIGVVADLYRASPHLREYHRRLTLEGPTQTLRIDMAEDWGGARRTSLYAVGEHELAVLGPAGDDHFFSLDPLATEREASLPSERWIYLGAFDFYEELTEGEDALMHRRSTFRFITPAEEAECIPILMEGELGGPHRNEHYRQNCYETHRALSNADGLRSR